MAYRFPSVLAGVVAALVAGCAASHAPAEPAVATAPPPAVARVPAAGSRSSNVAAPESWPVRGLAASCAQATLIVERVPQAIPSRILVDAVLKNTSDQPQRLPRRFHVPADIQVHLVRHVAGSADVVVLDGVPAVPEAIDPAAPLTVDDFDVIPPAGSVRRTLFVNGMVVGGLTPGSYVLTVSWCCLAAGVPAGLGDPPPVVGSLTAAPFAFEVRPPRVPPPGE